MLKVPGTFKSAVDLFPAGEFLILRAKSDVKKRSPASNAEPTEPILCDAAFLRVCSTESPTKSDPVSIEDASAMPRQTDGYFPIM